MDLCYKKAMISVYLVKMLDEEHFPSGKLRYIRSQGLDLSALISHAMFVDQRKETVTVPLNNDTSFEGKLELANSMLPQSFNDYCADRLS